MTCVNLPGVSDRSIGNKNQSKLIDLIKWLPLTVDKVGNEKPLASKSCFV